MKRLALAMLMTCLLAAPAAARGWHELDGRSALEISAATWLHVPEGDPSLESLEGKVWLLSFFGVH